MFLRAGAFTKYIQIVEQGQSDHAMAIKDDTGRVTQSIAEKRGGIDLTPENLNLIIKRNGNSDIPQMLTPEQLQRFKINDLTPIIINIQPVNNLPAFLGIQNQEQQKIALR